MCEATRIPNPVITVAIKYASGMPSGKKPRVEERGPDRKGGRGYEAAGQ